ncbi:MAG: hypothetical protein IPJ90_02580 [Anaerolineaceae bacterium]|nr:hypothetical protein [Anaerolineaceae bacterium]
MLLQDEQRRQRVLHVIVLHHTADVALRRVVPAAPKWAGEAVGERLQQRHVVAQRVGVCQFQVAPDLGGGPGAFQRLAQHHPGKTTQQPTVNFGGNGRPHHLTQCHRNTTLLNRRQFVWLVVRPVGGRGQIGKLLPE